MAVKGIKISELSIVSPRQSGLIPIAQDNETSAIPMSSIAINSTAFDIISANDITITRNIDNRGCINSASCITSNLNIITKSCFISGGRELLAVIGDSVAQTLQQATDNGNTTTNSISVNNNITFTCNLVGGLSSQVSGDFSSSLGGRCNRVTGNYSIVGGGRFNVLKGNNSVLLGSLSSKNYAGEGSVMIGGCNNVLSATRGGFYGLSVAIGGKQNTVTNRTATIVGGYKNLTCGENSSIIGGRCNIIPKGIDSFIGGGSTNKAYGNRQFIGNGYKNYIYSPGIPGYNRYSVIVGGCCNKIDCCTTNAFIGGGTRNCILSSYSFIGGGIDNIVCGNYSTIGGGCTNKNYGINSVIGGGKTNTVFKTVKDGTIGGGCFNTLSADYGRTIATYSTIAGGRNNCIQAQEGSIGGGANNKIYQRSCSSVIGGGNLNRICANSCYSTIAGGKSNAICGICSFIGGGYNNYNGGDCSVILGGNNNSTLFSNSFIIGSGLGTDRDNFTMVNNLSAECEIFSACGSSCNINLLDGSGSTFTLSISGGLIYAISQPDTGFDVLGVDEVSNNTLGSDATTQIRIAG